MTTIEKITNGKTALGIEFGSTRIKAVLIDEDCAPVASGGYDWENRLENGYWTYSLDDIMTGLRSSYASLKQNVREKYGVTLTKAGAIGISGMMHGYLAFDENDKLLTPFRTWRNTTTAEAAEELSPALGFSRVNIVCFSYLDKRLGNKLVRYFAETAVNSADGIFSEHSRLFRSKESLQLARSSGFSLCYARYLHVNHSSSLHFEKLSRLHVADTVSESGEFSAAWNDIRPSPDACRCVANPHSRFLLSVGCACRRLELCFSYVLSANVRHLNRSVSLFD